MRAPIRIPKTLCAMGGFAAHLIMKFFQFPAVRMSVCLGQHYVNEFVPFVTCSKYQCLIKFVAPLVYAGRRVLDVHSCSSI